MFQVNRRKAVAFAAALCVLPGSPVHAQAYPSRPVTVVVAFQAGGQTDAVARSILPGLQKGLRQTLIVENVPGAGGSLGMQKVLNAAAGGHTVSVATPIELIQTPMAMTHVRYKPEDFRMVAPVGSTHLMMVVRPDLPVSSVEEFVALARKSGKELSYGSVGRGSAYHLVAERFAHETGIRMLHVPYKGAQGMMTDVIGGQIDMAFIALGGPVLGMIQTGRLKAIGFTGPKRHASVPDVPTMNESRLVKDFVFDLWAALMVPKSTPEAVIGKLSAALHEVLKQPELRSSFEGLGVQPADPMSPGEAERFYASEISRYRSIGKAIDLQPE